MVLRLGWLPIEYGDKAINDGHVGGVVPLGQYHKAGRALDQRAHRCAVAGTLDQVAFLVAPDCDQLIP